MPRHRRTEGKSSAILSKVKLSVFFLLWSLFVVVAAICYYFLFSAFFLAIAFPTQIFISIYSLFQFLYFLFLWAFFFSVWKIPYHSCLNKFPFVDLPFDFYLETCYQNNSSHNTIQWPPWTKTAHKTLIIAFSASLYSREIQ